MTIISAYRLNIIAICLLLVSGYVVAEEKKYLLSQSTYEQLTIAQDAMAEDNYSIAHKQLTTLASKVESGSYDQAVVLQTLGYLYISLDDYEKAITYFNSALKLAALPSKVEHDLRYNLGQLQLASQQYKVGIENIELWLKDESSPRNETYVLLASAYYQLNSYKKVVSYISKAIKNDKSPDESWYQMLLSAHISLKQNKSAIKVLEVLIGQYPYKKQYWQQLTYLYLDQKQELRATAVSALVEKLALGDDKTVLNLADMYRYLYIPYKSGQVLEKALNEGVLESNFDNLQKLADSWLAARDADKAVAVLGQMAELDPTGETDLKLGRVYIGTERWQQAITPINASLEKLPKSEQGLSHLLLGTAYFYLNQPAQAEKMFKKALNDKEHRVQASQWLNHLAQHNTEPEADDAS